jgi:hypothetical protein
MGDAHLPFLLEWILRKVRGQCRPSGIEQCWQQRCRRSSVPDQVESQLGACAKGINTAKNSFFAYWMRYAG